MKKKFKFGEVKILKQEIIFYFLIFSIISLGLGTIPALAEGSKDPVGSVIAVRGDVKAVSASGDSRKLSLKSPIYREDTIKTGKRGRSQIMFTDNTIVSLGRNSEMQIAEYEFRPDEKTGKMKTKVTEGVFRIMGGSITKVAPEKFTTETPAATIGIRGSMYAGKVTGDTLAVVFQGGKSIYVSNAAGIVNISIPGFGTHVKGPHKAPLRPEKFTPDDIANLNNDAAQNDDGPEQEDQDDKPDKSEKTETDAPDSAKEKEDQPADTSAEKTDQASPADKREDDNDESAVDHQADDTNEGPNEGSRADQDANRPPDGQPRDGKRDGPPENGEEMPIAEDGSPFPSSEGGHPLSEDGETPLTAEYSPNPEGESSASYSDADPGMPNPDGEAYPRPPENPESYASMNENPMHGGESGALPPDPGNDAAMAPMGEFNDQMFSGEGMAAGEGMMAGDMTMASPDGFNPDMDMNLGGTQIFDTADSAPLEALGNTLDSINDAINDAFQENISQYQEEMESDDDLYANDPMPDDPCDPASNEPCDPMANDPTSDTDPPPDPDPDPPPDPDPDPETDPYPYPDPDSPPYPDSDPPPDPDPDPDPGPSPDPVVANLAGKYIGVKFDTDTGTGTGDYLWSGSVSVTSTDGSTTGSATATQDGKVFPITFTIAPHDAGHAYDGSDSYTTDRVVNLNSADWTFTNLMEIWSEDLGEFAVYYLPNSGFDGGSYKFQEMGFAGIASTTLPIDGVREYEGEFVTGFQTIASGDIYASWGAAHMSVNWHNGKVLGHLDDGTIFFGDVTGTTLNNVQFTGDRNGGGVVNMSGTTTFAQFYGSKYQGFGLTAGGNEVDVKTQGNLSTWETVFAGFRRIDNPSIDVSPSGSVLLEGFTIGVAEDMDNPNVARRFYMNDTASQFQFTVNADTGALNGTLSADDILSAYQIVNMTVGDTNGSAFILYDNFAAGLGGTNVITDGGSSGDLKANGNFLVAENSADQFSTHFTWGYWETAYVDPGTAGQYHIHHPGALWIAGVKTPAAYVQGLIDGPAATGNYVGNAKGIEISPGGAMSALTGGITNLDIDFALAKASAASAVTGSINFDQMNFTVDSVAAAVTNSGFSAFFSDAGVNTSAVNGAFFGPNAEAIAGNFQADMLSGARYLGIFGGDKP